MGQITTETIKMIRECAARGEHAPLTIWEVEQLATAWEAWQARAASAEPIGILECHASGESTFCPDDRMVLELSIGEHPVYAAPVAAQAPQPVTYLGATVAERLDSMADDQPTGSLAQSDLYAAASAWRKHLAGPLDERTHTLRWIMREAEAAKEPCGDDPESHAAVRNGKLAAIAQAAAQALGMVHGPSYAQAQAVPEGRPLDTVNCIAIATRGFEAWAGKPHNAKWVKKIDGTPIPNDVVVCIAMEFRDALLAGGSNG